MSQLAWHSILLSAAKIISGLASIMGGIILARWLTKEEYGTYSQLVLIASTLVFFSNFSLPRSLYFFIPRARSVDERKHVSFQVITATMFFSILCTLLILPFAPFLANFMQNPAIKSSIIFIACYLFFLSVSDLFEPFMVSVGHVPVMAWVEALCGVGFILAILVPLILGIDYRCILILYSAILGIKIIVMLYYFFQMEGEYFGVSVLGGIFKKIQYAAPLALGSMIGILGRRIDQFIISSMYLPAEYAIYARGAFELPLITLIPMTISNLMLPEFVKDFSNNRVERVAWQFADKARKVALIFFPLTILMLILAKAFIVLMFSDKYLGSVPIFRIYLLILPFRITIHGVIFKAVGKTYLFIVGDLLYIFSNVFISLVLIKLFGMNGAAWGTVIAVAIFVFYFSLNNSKILNIPLSRLFPWYHLLKIAIVSGISGILVLPLLYVINSYFMQLIIITVLFFVYYVFFESQIVLYFMFF